MTSRRVGKKAKERGPGLRARLAEAEATLEAIRTGEVDALVVSGPGGTATRAIEGATHPYHVLLDAMGDGAALLDIDGTILFANRRLAELAGVPVERLRGSQFGALITAAGRPRFDLLWSAATGRRTVGEFGIVRHDGAATQVAISLSTIPLDLPVTGATNGAVARMAILADLTERKHAADTRLELMKRLITVEDEERRRIARELHDETGQSLTALLVGLRAIEERTQSPEVKDAAHRLRAIASQTVDNVGRLARGLHPSVLDDLGLLAAIRRHVSDYTKSYGLPVELRSDGIVTSTFAPLVQTTVYRILQEALTNVARHAEAESVRVELRTEGSLLELVVTDDGRGFDTEGALREASGLGLHGMGERVVLMGGTLGVDSRPGAGTTIRARIPLGDDARGPQ
jgi:PAS domain S-box-containing protein